jgi:2,3-bisphosphoglycerate-independent phosphoglycerate mutase
MSCPHPVVLCILDGWGYRAEKEHNAIAAAHTPVWDELWASCPHAFIRTDGLSVGLPEGQMGNSEVGHLTIGAGRVLMQDLPKIDQAVASGELAKNPVLLDHVAKLKESGGVCHLMGLCSPGGVHAHQDHMLALARIVAAAGVKVAVHVFTDGRDVPPQSAAQQVAGFAAALPQGAGIATVSGRYYAMDRDKRWERVEQAYRAMVEAKAPRSLSAATAIGASCAENVTDEFIKPVVMGDYAGMKSGDGILFANFRSDRAREILEALLNPAFSAFARPEVHFAAATGMAEYSSAHNAWLTTLFPPKELTDVLGEVVSRAGKKQLRLAETEKYAHVTFFLNGGEEKIYPGEERILVPSPKVATYDLQPEMSAAEVAQNCVEAIEGGQFDLIVLNFANPDMVGHTGMLPAAIKAIEAVDAGVDKIRAALAKTGGAMLITADHGNCEELWDEASQGPHTAHSLNPVPVVVVGAKGVVRDGTLADIAPTLLTLMGLPVPDSMSGKSLLES